MTDAVTPAGDLTLSDVLRNFYATLNAVTAAAAVIMASTREPHVLAEHNQRIDGLSDMARELIRILEQSTQSPPVARAICDNIREVIGTIQRLRL